MSMLAEPRSRQKWSDDPRNTRWANDKSKFGYQMLTKMGWSDGKGLGQNEHGTVSHIRVKKNKSNAGIGSKRSHDDDWISHQTDFNDLLNQLNKGSSTVSKKIQSLEEKVKSSKKKILYTKFVKSKDLSNASSHDLACIFGQRSKSAPATPQLSDEEGVQSDASAASCPITEKDAESKREHGITTVHSGVSVADYFAKKMEALTKARNKKWEEQFQELDTSEKLTDTQDIVDDEVKQKKKKKRKKEKKYGVERIVEFSREGKSSCDFSENEFIIKKKKKKKKKKIAEDIEVEGVEDCSSEVIVSEKDMSNGLNKTRESCEVTHKKSESCEVTHKKRKRKEENNNLEIVKKKKKKSKEENNDDECVIVSDDDDGDSHVKLQKKQSKSSIPILIEIKDNDKNDKSRKKRSKSSIQDAIVINDDEKKPFTMKKKITNIVEVVGTGDKEKKLSSSDETCVIIDDENVKKKKKKKITSFS